MPQVVERVLEVPKISSQDRNLQGTVEQIPDVLVPEMVDQFGDIAEDRIRGQNPRAERIDAIPVPQDVEELVEDRSQQCFVEHTDETPDISLAKIVEGPVTQTQGKTQQVVNTCVQHVVDTAEVEQKTAEVPLLQFIDVAQRHIRANLNVQITIEIPQLQIADKVSNAPVVLVVQAPQSQVVAEIAEIPQLQVADKVVDVPVVLVVQDPLVQVMAITVQIPQLPFVEKIAVLPTR